VDGSLYLLGSLLAGGELSNTASLKGGRMDPVPGESEAVLRDEEMARIDHGQPPWKLAAPSGVALVCLGACISSTAGLASEGKPCSMDRVDYTSPIQSGTDFSGQAPLAFSFLWPGPRRRCQLRRRRPARFDPHPGQFFAADFVGPISAMPLNGPVDFSGADFSVPCSRRGLELAATSVRPASRTPTSAMPLLDAATNGNFAAGPWQPSGHRRQHPDLARMPLNPGAALAVLSRFPQCLLSALSLSPARNLPGVEQSGPGS